MTTDNKANMGKYERMKKLGMPTASIINRMRMDGVETSIIEQWSGVSGSTNKESQNSSSESSDIMAIKPKSSTMKPFHWTKFTKIQVENTLWKESEKTLTHYKIDYSLLEQKFSRTKDEKSTSSSSSQDSEQKQDSTTKDTETEKIDSILDSRRIQNVMIGLARIGLDDNEILEAILNLDDTKLPPDKVQHLIPCAPTDGELEMVRAYVKAGGDVSKLSGAEKFFVKLMDLVSVKQMLKLWLLKSQFEPRVNHIRERIQLVEGALQKLRGSENLRQVLEVILAVGNFLNYGTSRGNAYGFHLEPALDMIDGLKANDKSMSLLVFVIEQLQSACPDSLKWIEEFEILTEASKVGSSSLQSDVDELQRDIQELEKRVKAHRRTMTKTHSDWAREGVSIGLQHVASHIRTVSRLPKALQMAELSNYGTLRAPLKESEKEEEEKQENQFSMSMLRFYKRENTTVRQVDTELKKLELECKQTASYFGCDEDTKWEELFAILVNFRERFIKAQREIEAENKKKERQEKQLQKQQELDAQLKKRPQKPAFSQGQPTEEQSSNTDTSPKPTSHQQRTFDMYALYQKTKTKTGD